MMKSETPADVLARDGGRPVRTEPFPNWPNLGQEEIQAAVEVLRTGQFTRLSGQKVMTFEHAFAKKFGRKHGIAVSSGTSAIQVILMAYDIGPGDEVIHTPHCYIGTALPTVAAAAIPVFADIDPREFNITGETVAAKVTSRTKAIVPVHLNGLPADMDGIMAVAEKHGLLVIEDAAQAHGATYKGRYAGAIGHAACYSFWEDKLMSVGGEGGMIILDDDEVALRAKMISNNGEVPDEGDYYEGERLYEHAMLGYNNRMSELEAAIGMVQLGRLEGYIKQRRENAHYLTELLANVPGIITPYEPQDRMHVFYKYMITLDRKVLGVSAKEFVAALQAEGIPCSRRYPTPIHMQGVFTQLRGFGGSRAPFCPPWYDGALEYGPGHLPVAEKLPNDLVRLLMNPELSKKDLEDTAIGVRKVAAAYVK